MSLAAVRRIVVTGVATLTVGVMAPVGAGLAPARADDVPSPPAASAGPGEPRDLPPTAPQKRVPADGPDGPVAPHPDGSADPAPPGPAGPGPGKQPADAGERPAPGEKRADPVSPRKPAEPEAPQGRGEPAPPENPGGPGKPGAPEDPQEPGTPAEPTAPGPSAPESTSAAERYGWGAPGPGSDEFDYTGAPDPSRWSQAGECWAGHAGNGRRCASRSWVDGSKLVQTGLFDGDSGWVASRTNQQYGRWEARVRSRPTGPNTGRQYHPLLIIWPQSDRWPEDGEYDFLENNAPGEPCAESYIHYPHDPGPVQQIFTREKNCGAPLSVWHNVAFEWTPDHVRGYIDGRQWFSYSGGARPGRRAIQAMPSGHLTIQLDNFYGGFMQPATYEVDWVHIYPLR